MVALEVGQAGYFCGSGTRLAARDARPSFDGVEVRDSHAEKELLKEEMQDMRSNERALYEKLAG